MHIYRYFRIYLPIILVEIIIVKLLIISIYTQYNTCISVFRL